MTNDELKEMILDNGYDDIIIFSNPGYETAFIGISEDNRAVYDFDRMVEYLQEHDDMDEIEAIEYIEYNVIHDAGYTGENYPIIVRSLI